METNKFVSKSSRRPQDDRMNNDHLLKLTDTLDLPDGAGFESHYVRVGLEAMVELCEARLPLFNSRPDAEERRLRDKCDVEFVL